MIKKISKNSKHLYMYNKYLLYDRENAFLYNMNIDLALQKNIKVTFI